MPDRPDTRGMSMPLRMPAGQLHKKETLLPNANRVSSFCGGSATTRV